MATGAHYAIRAFLLCLVPTIGLVWDVLWSFSGLRYVASVLSAALILIEHPRLCKAIFGPRRARMKCLNVPFIARLVMLYAFQIWWLVLCDVRAELDVNELRSTGQHSKHQESEVARQDDSAAQTQELAWAPKTISVVLPCAQEGVFALKTVQAVAASAPADVVREILVVDDGSEPPLSASYLASGALGEALASRVKILRHNATQGLISAKRTGGEAASGDIVVFFDCHVSPRSGWHRGFLERIATNYKRIVVPRITNLDVDTWSEKRSWMSSSVSKCYLTWDADFKWMQSDDEYVPVLSGGLLGISKRWWNETGGYDDQMKGWGGENLDQSLRSWLCGGEIVAASESSVAHMWRDPVKDPRTTAKYTLPPTSAARNRMRAAAAWMGPFAEKLGQFPLAAAGGPSPRLPSAVGGPLPWFGDVSNIRAVAERLDCKPFAWFLHRFKSVYEDGGLLPAETFLLKEESSRRCLAYLGSPGTHPAGRGDVALEACAASSARQRWHGANKDRKSGGGCCSGLRAWNTDQCLTTASGGKPATSVCDVTGKTSGEGWALGADGLLRSSAGCLTVNTEGVLQVSSCRGLRGGAALWRKAEAKVPLETQLYHEALASHPEWGT